MNRIYHHWEKWECVKAGFYETAPPVNMTPDAARLAYRDFLADIPRFDSALKRVLSEWVNSCDQFLSNDNINRIAWLGQASMCIDTGVPSCYRGGFKMLSPAQQRAANLTAEAALKTWLKGKSDAANARKSFEVHRELETMRLF